jgi:syntaxin-binding protein 1
VHYRVARTIDASTLTTVRDLVPTKLAASVWNCLAKYKSTIPEFPQTETCELLIVDRSIDQVRDVSYMFEILSVSSDCYRTVGYSLQCFKIS